MVLLHPHTPWSLRHCTHNIIDKVRTLMSVDNDGTVDNLGLNNAGLVGTGPD